MQNMKISYEVYYYILKSKNKKLKHINHLKIKNLN
jgi:hypothetical protein